MTDSYKDKGLTGLANLGNTCFIATALKMLLNSGSIVNLILSVSNLNSNALAYKLQSFFKLYFQSR